jgi:hypothetical protein
VPNWPPSAAGRLPDPSHPHLITPARQIRQKESNSHAERACPRRRVPVAHVAGADQGLLPVAVEELIRFVQLTSTLPPGRVTTEEVTLGGPAKIKSGHVAAATSAANSWPPLAAHTVYAGVLGSTQNADW